MKSELSRRELLFEESPRIGLKLLLLPSALTGLARLVFAEEDYLSKLPPLNGRKVTEELIEDMLNIGSVRGILEKYGNKDNMFYVQFQPDGRNNLDELVKKEHEKWDGSYVLVDDDYHLEEMGFRQTIVTATLLNEISSTKFIFYDLNKDKKLIHKGKIATMPLTHFVIQAFNHYLTPINNETLKFPVKLLYSRDGKLLDGGDTMKKEKTVSRNRYLWATFYNDKLWMEHWLYSKHKIDDDGKNIRIRYDFGKRIKKEATDDKK